MLFTNVRILKFKSQLTIVFFTGVNHLNGPLGKQNFTSTRSWSVICDWWISIRFVFQGSLLVIVIMIDGSETRNWPLLIFRVRMFVKSAVNLCVICFLVKCVDRFREKYCSRFWTCLRTGYELEKFAFLKKCRLNFNFLTNPVHLVYWPKFHEVLKTCEMVFFTWIFIVTILRSLEDHRLQMQRYS